MPESRPETPLPLYVVERTRLLAHALGRASTASFMVGVAGPLAAAVWNIGEFRTSVGDVALATGITSWLVACLVLHWMSKLTLQRLE